MEFWQNRQPERYEWFLHSLILKQQGAQAASVYGMPTDSAAWQQAQGVLAVLWQQQDLQTSRVLNQLIITLGKG